jgi:hypothetical protein
MILEPYTLNNGMLPFPCPFSMLTFPFTLINTKIKTVTITLVIEL